MPQTASCNHLCACSLLSLLSCSLSLVLAFVCSSCRAGELAALLLRFWQIKRLAQALRLISCSADVHRRRNT